ncbi:MAG: hypothetical protein GY765_16120 [bacterium]|nr:hypothetical protein [bacterium]
MEIVREIRDITSERTTINLPEKFMNRRVEILVLPLFDTIDTGLTTGMCAASGIAA